jgi:excisionase family DNA binding protein
MTADPPASYERTVAEAAEQLLLSYRQALALVKAGELPARRVGNQYLIRQADIEAYDERRRRDHRVVPR